MDVIVLCGGFGTRMEPIGLFIPKALLPIRGRPLLDHIVEDLGRYRQVERIIVNTNSRFADQFEYYVNLKNASGFAKKIELLIEPTKHNGEKLGQIKGIEYVIKNSKVSSDIMIVSGDNYFDFKLSDLINHFEKSRKPTLGLYETGSMELLTRSGVLNVQGNVITEFEEKPAKPKSNLLSMGIYLFPKEMIGLFDDYMKGNSNHDSMGYFIKWLVDRQETHGVKCKGIWVDIGTIEAYKKVFETR
ncbi:MAG: nucleotidyltransferase family protein [Candidatus Micrarchaeota archaeon]|nr:nucleotidyltransferase family protein [Candidatus Micrarchaeota archaeon]